jgi:ATP-binding cassette subfamily B multidrug efflux pump
MALSKPMLAKIFNWFETRIDAFPDQAPTRPPATMLAFYWHFLEPIWPVLIVLLVVGFAGTVIEVALLAWVGTIVDTMRATQSPERFAIDNAWWLAGMALVALVARPLISTVHDLLKNQMIAPAFTTRVRWLTHRYVIRQSMGFFQNDFAGRVANHIMQTAYAVRESTVALVESIWYATVHCGGTIFLFWSADVRLVAPVVLWIVGYAAILAIFVPKVQKLSAASAEGRSMVMGRIVDSYTNISTVKLFSHTDREDAYAREGMLDSLDRWRAANRNLTLMEFCIWSLNGILIVSATGLAIWLWMHGNVSLGAVAVVTGLTIRLMNISGWIFWVVAGIFDNIGTVKEGMETIAKANTILDVPEAVALEVPKGEIVFDRVKFNYGKAKGLPGANATRVIDGLSLTIKPGEKVGLVGRSGAGKSTLVNLLLRFYDLEAGRILIDGQDISKVTQDSLRANIGMVTQDTSLMHRAVRDNILYGRPNAGEVDLLAAAEKAQAHAFIDGLEDGKGRKGYHAHVGERGVKLSGGQRQRIAIARVLLKNAPILILDEATSALDSEVEAAIQEQFQNLMEGKTVIAIAHRLSTIAAMDRLIIMDNGRIIEDGTHAQLLAKGGLYSELWTRQSGGFLARDEGENDQVAAE